MKRLAFAGLALIATTAATAPVWAADLPQAPAPVYEPEPRVVIDWTGIYVGANVGWAFANFDNDSGDASSGDTDSGTDVNGVSGGLYAGYNFQVTPSVVVGAEADFSLTGLTGDAETDSATALESKSIWNSNVRARLGFNVERVLVYGAGGLALANLEVSSSDESASTTALGWTAGGGADALLTDNLKARLEYVYQDFGSQDFDLGDTEVSSGFSNSTVRVGVGYKF